MYKFGALNLLVPTKHLQDPPCLDKKHVKMSMSKKSIIVLPGSPRKNVSNMIFGHKSLKKSTQHFLTASPWESHTVLKYLDCLDRMFFQQE